MNDRLEAIHSLDDLRGFIHAALCDKENLVPEQFQMREMGPAMRAAVLPAWAAERAAGGDLGRRPEHAVPVRCAWRALSQTSAASADLCGRAGRLKSAAWVVR